MGTSYNVTLENAVVRKDKIDELVITLGGNPSTDLVNNINKLLGLEFDDVYGEAFINDRGDLDLSGITLCGYGSYSFLDTFDNILRCCQPGAWFTEDNEDAFCKVVTSIDENGYLNRVVGQTVYINHLLPVDFGNLLLDLAFSDTDEDILEAARTLKSHLPPRGAARPINFLQD